MTIRWKVYCNRCGKSDEFQQGVATPEEYEVVDGGCVGEQHVCSDCMPEYLSVADELSRSKNKTLIEFFNFFDRQPQEQPEVQK